MHHSVSAAYACLVKKHLHVTDMMMYLMLAGRPYSCYIPLYFCLTALRDVSPRNSHDRLLDHAAGHELGPGCAQCSRHALATENILVSSETNGSFIPARLQACLVLVEKRETRYRVQWYYRLFEETQRGLTRYPNSVDHIHGSLLALGELLRHTGASTTFSLRLALACGISCFNSFCMLGLHIISLPWRNMTDEREINERAGGTFFIDYL